MKIQRNHLELLGNKPFQGQSIEEKVRICTETNQPIEAISPMIFTERKEGVRADTNIRTDKWDVAQQAMTSIAEGKRVKRQERINPKSDEVDKPAANSKMNVQSTDNQ